MDAFCSAEDFSTSPSPQPDSDSSLVVKSLNEIEKKILKGLSADAVLNFAFDSLGVFVPFDRVGVALQDGKLLRSHWVKSRLPVNHLKVGYSAPIANSSLEKVLASNKPRVIGDLTEYLRENPNSHSTQLIVQDGMRSNLTLPLQLEGNTFGVIFFSSGKPNIYTSEHMRILEGVTKGLALVVEHMRLRQFSEESRNKEGMLLKVMHDLRSPLAVISGFTDLLTDSADLGAVGEDAKNMLAIIRRNTQLMLGIMSDFGDLMALSQNRYSINLKAVNLKQFMQESLDGLRPICSKKNITLNFQSGLNTPSTWNFDPLRIRQVLENLVSNAVKFSNPGTTITIRNGVENDCLYFSISDQGLGIPQKELPNLFHEFGVTSVQSTAGEPSTGLGLAICKQIVEGHKGEISVLTKENCGSIFRFSLPSTGLQNK